MPGSDVLNLHRALALRPKEIVTLVGAGGKTSALLCLARELAARGRRVVAAPTTKMRLTQLQELAAPVIACDSEALVRGVEARLEKANLATCGTALTGDGKVTGLDPATVAALLRLDVEYLLLEGDGAAGALLKAPAAYEPVIPRETTLVVTVAGLPVVGRPLAAPGVHRSRLVAGLLGREEGVLLAVEDVARILVHPAGGRKGVPPGARWAVLLNQAEDYGLQEAGRAVAAAILTAGGERVIVGAVATPAPVRQVLRAAAGGNGTVGGIVLAAGAGVRYGGGKQLLPVGGQPLVRQVVGTALAAVPGDVVTVLGHQAEMVAAVLEDLAVNLAYNPDYHRGLSTSLQAGLAALAPRTRAALFILADQPGVTPGVLARLVEAYTDSGKKIVVPVYQGRRGNPVLIDRDLWPQILALEGDIGAREIIRAHPVDVLEVEVDCPGILKDIDTPADYCAWLEGK
ncbi:MAG: putative selenium-dependent hydroxylase accessory protein YqeC [Moorella sp. (in: Bacteria)]|nr:putative selenium-dependent hydroxylase accessory protein YqeC [Moorella sp. (in: firmicutes)]